MITCKNCSYWVEAKVEKKGNLTNKMKSLRFCPAEKKEIESDTEACRFFNPNMFYCDKTASRQTFLCCLNRRRNQKEFSYWEQCKKCRQFEREIKDIIVKYYIKAETPEIPEEMKTEKQKSKDKKAGPPVSKTKNLGTMEMQKGGQILKRLKKEKEESKKAIIARHKKRRVLKRRAPEKDGEKKRVLKRRAPEKENPPEKKVLKRRARKEIPEKKVLKRRKSQDGKKNERE